MGVIFFDLFFQGLGIEKIRFSRGPTFNNSTTLQWFSLFFTFSINLHLHKFWFNFGSHFGSILGDFGDLDVIFGGFFGCQKIDAKSRWAEGAEPPIDLARTPTETCPTRADI